MSFLTKLGALGGQSPCVVVLTVSHAAPGSVGGWLSRCFVTGVRSEGIFNLLKTGLIPARAEKLQLFLFL